MIVTVTKNHINIVGYFKLIEILNRIRNKEKAGEIIKLRQLHKQRDISKYNLLKEKLPAFIVTGKYNGSISQYSLNDYSKMACLDIDNVPKGEIEHIKSTICCSPYTLACFISPSGEGLKVICKVDTTAKFHPVAYKQLGEYYYGLSGLDYDSRCNNINRLCYLSYDPELYYNDRSRTFHVDLTWHMSQGILFENEIRENNGKSSLNYTSHEKWNNGSL